MEIIIIYASSIIILSVVLFIIIRTHYFIDYDIVNEVPLKQVGIYGECTGFYVKSSNIGKINPDWFHTNTLIMGYDNNGNLGPSRATFNFKIQNVDSYRNVDSTINLLIESERIHGGLHSKFGPKEKRAKIYINEKIIDEFYLIQKMPNGEDYGYRNVGPFQIDPSLLNTGNNKVKLEIENDMAWDIDKVIIKLSRGKKRLSVVGSMIAGAIISVIIGLIPLLIEKLAILFNK